MDSKKTKEQIKDMKIEIWHVVKNELENDCGCPVKSFGTEHEAREYYDYITNTERDYDNYYVEHSKLDIATILNKNLPPILTDSSVDIIRHIAFFPNRNPGIISYRASCLLGLPSEHIETWINKNINWFPKEFYYEPNQSEINILQFHGTYAIGFNVDYKYFINSDGLFCFLSHLDIETAEKVKHRIVELFDGLDNETTYLKKSFIIMREKENKGENVYENRNLACSKYRKRSRFIL